MSQKITKDMKFNEILAHGQTVVQVFMKYKMGCLAVQPPSLKLLSRVPMPTALTSTIFLEISTPRSKTVRGQGTCPLSPPMHKAILI